MRSLGLRDGYQKGSGAENDLEAAKVEEIRKIGSIIYDILDSESLSIENKTKIVECVNSMLNQADEIQQFFR